jgi:hypothetical protein
VLAGTLRIMESLTRRMLFGAMALAPVLVGGPGCADSESMLFIRQAQALVAGKCTVDNSPTSVSLLRGSLDIAFQSQYRADLLVGNQLVPRGNSSQLRTETARVQIQGSIARAEDANGAVAWGPVTVPGSGFIDPASGADASFGVVSSVLLGTELTANLTTELQADPTLVRHFTSVIRVFGRTLGGMSIESGEWRFPINVCYGCTIVFPPEAIDPKVMPIPNCDLAASTGGTVARPCIVGQDDVVDCRVCKETFPHARLCEP